MLLQETALKIINAAIDSVKPETVIRNRITLHNGILVVDKRNYRLNDYDGVYLIGAGKASAQMASAMEKILGDKLNGGIIITKYHHSVPTERTKIYEAGHPVPDENTLKHTSTMLKYISELPPNALIITLISGGGSSLMEQLPPELELSDVQKTVSSLLRSGATITEINTLRKHLSLVKGGRLLQTVSPRTNISLIISDVIGDPLDFIASGPTAPDATTFQEALNILDRYVPADARPANIINFLNRGLKGEIMETPDETDPVFAKNQNFILANNRLALQTAMTSAEESGFNILSLGSMIEGEAKEVGIVAAGIAKSINFDNRPIPRPAALLWGGETTVTITGNGKGGRNQELALSFYNALKTENITYCFVACGTDGTDGPTDAAGALVWSGNARLKKTDPAPYLENNDAYHFWQRTEALLKTGPTQTNVMDINLLLIP